MRHHGFGHSRLQLLFVMLCLSVSFVSYASWDKNLAPLGSPPHNSQVKWLRTLVHMHSVYSHDACDGKPFRNSGPNMPCLRSLRKAMCDNHIDIVFLTEHKDRMALYDFNQLLVPLEGDEVRWENDHIISLTHHCPSGHRTLYLPGAENHLMPIGQMRHPEPIMSAAQRNPDDGLWKAYQAHDRAGVERFHDTGALVAIPHLEKRSLEKLRELRPDILEIYNVHANLQKLTGSRNPLKWLKHASGLLSYLYNPFVEPDLFGLDFIEVFPANLKKWGQYSVNHPVSAVFGSDAHENTFPVNASDGERIDSYRRVTRTFSNTLIVPRHAPLTRETALEALARARALMVFEVLGTPRDFEFLVSHSSAEASLGEILMNDTSTPATFSNPAAFVRVSASHPDPILLKIWKASVQGWTLVDKIEDSTWAGRLPGKGKYRVEVYIKAKHLFPQLPGKWLTVLKWRPWIYSNTIEIQ